MGLDISHDAFHGAYSAFNRFRQIVCRAMGDGSFPPHEPDARDDDGKPLDPDAWYWGKGFSEATHPGLAVLLLHADSDGEIAPADCARLADELEALLPAIRAVDDGGGGHIAAAGGYVAVTERFIEGCRAAAKAGEPLEFA